MNEAQKIVDRMLRDRKIVKMVEVTDKQNFLFWHFLAMHIRNKFLWGEEDLTEKLMKFYCACNVDEVSECLIKDLCERIFAIQNSSK